jgi:hypothetical protein
LFLLANSKFRNRICSLNNFHEAFFVLLAQDDISQEANSPHLKSTETAAKQPASMPKEDRIKNRGNAYRNTLETG